MLDQSNQNHLSSPNDQPATPTPAREVYVMPEKFRPATAKSGGLGLIIAAVILLAVIAVSAGYFGYDYYVKLLSFSFYFDFHIIGN
jgi:hypothetical protein